MRRSDLTICLITDEVSPSLDEGLAFAREEGIGTVDLRVIDGRNVLALSRGELADAAQRVGAAGLAVSCICTPLLKWSPPGKTSRTTGDQFGFELGARTPRDVYAEAFAAAEILGARNLRVFSYLTYDDYCLDDLRTPIDDLLALAERFDMKVHVENEGVCNIQGFAELEALMTAYRHPRLRALPDIANACPGRRQPLISRGCYPSPISCTSRTTPMLRAGSSPLVRAISRSRACWRRRCPPARRP
jgi:sugar phosphate isomerase/epimerase